MTGLLLFNSGSLKGRKHLCSRATTRLCALFGAAPNFTIIYSSQVLWGERRNLNEGNMAVVGQPEFDADTESRFMSNSC